MSIRPVLLLQCLALILAVVLCLLQLNLVAELGAMSLTIRWLLAALTVVFVLIGLYPVLPWFRRHPGGYATLIGIPAILVCSWYYMAYLPGRASQQIIAQQLASDLISESTSNGIIEIGFAYPIFTPTLQITSNDLYTRRLDAYLRILDGNNEAALFRAVRDELPDNRLSVEATVRGLLSENTGYLFNPVILPPMSTVEGRLVFVISDLSDGTTFNEALGRSYPASFELRDPESGELVLSFPMTRI